MSQEDTKNIVLIGATGSIGRSTLEVVRASKGKLKLLGIANSTREKELLEIADEFSVPHARCYKTHGMEGLIELATLEAADIILIAATGTVGLQPCLAAIEANKTIALASKEVLVMAGEFVMQAHAKSQSVILPVDSEHNAIFQCIHAEDPKHIRRLILTASGGPFRDYTLEQMKHVSLEAALKHPNWDMGPKITIDSATMANKGLEMIEARWLFGVEPSQIDVVVHPQSLVHSMAEFTDGSILAQLSPPSMTFAIQYALSYPERDTAVRETIDFSQALSLDFRPPNEMQFPCLRLARESMEKGGVAPTVYNAANECAVEAFIKGAIDFGQIPHLVEDVLDTISLIEPENLEAILTTDKEARCLSQAWLNKHK